MFRLAAVRSDIIIIIIRNGGDGGGEAWFTFGDRLFAGYKNVFRVWRVK